MMLTGKLFFAVMAVTLVSAHPMPHYNLEGRAVTTKSHTAAHARATAKGAHKGNATVTGAGLESFGKGNEHFKSQVGKINEKNGHPYTFLTCTDLTIDPGSTVQVPLGSSYTLRNMGNQYSEKSGESHAALSFAVTAGDSKHIIVMGHYGCGSVRRAIEWEADWNQPSSTHPQHNWLKPVRDLYKSSKRPEIVKLRQHKAKGRFDDKDPGFRALVEENIKHTVHNLKFQSFLARGMDIAPEKHTNGTDNHHHHNSTSPAKPHANKSQSSTSSRHVKRAEKPERSRSNKKNEKGTKKPEDPKSKGSKSGKKDLDVFVHGFVLDPSTGEVKNLNISFGPAGKAIPRIPLPLVGGNRTHTDHHDKHSSKDGKNKSKKNVNKEKKAKGQGGKPEEDMYF